MKIMLQCRGSGDRDWSILNTTMYPVGPTWFDDDQRRKAEKHIDKLMQGWSNHLFDHQFRVVKPKGF